LLIGDEVFRRRDQKLLKREKRGWRRDKPPQLAKTEEIVSREQL